jgi:hypothetical protein
MPSKEKVNPSSDDVDTISSKTSWSPFSIWHEFQNPANKAPTAHNTYMGHPQGSDFQKETEKI